MELGMHFKFEPFSVRSCFHRHRVFQLNSRCMIYLLGLIHRGIVQLPRAYLCIQVQISALFASRPVSLHTCWAVIIHTEDAECVQRGDKYLLTLLCIRESPNS